MDTIILKTRSEVKFKVTVTQLWYATLRHPKMHPHTKFEIPTSNNIRDCLFDLILYVPSTIFQLYRDESSWVEPVLS